MKVNFNQPIIFEETLGYLDQAIKSHHLSGMGPFTQKCEELLNIVTGAPNLMVTSATHALEMMGLLLDIKSGDEVILPSFTFVSTANAFVLRGAKLRFADNDEFGNLKPTEVERLLTAKTKAIVTVHYAGNSADMDKLLAVSKQARVPLVEDAAQAIGATFKEKALGTFGSFGCFSFHETKNVSAGEGGSLICGNQSLIERGEIIREKGTNRRRFLRGIVDKYTWIDVGSSYVLSDLNCAYLYPQLLKLNQINSRRRELWKRYKQALERPLERIGAVILTNPKHNENPNAHLFALVMPSIEIRTSYIEYMRGREIMCPFHYVSLHTSPFGQKTSVDGVESLPNCEYLSAGLVRLPLFYNLADEQQAYVISETLKWLSLQ
jgi:dTDP-4-amino-4,6-dideoxygalactose transaminase